MLLKSDIYSTKAPFSLSETLHNSAVTQILTLDNERQITRISWELAPFHISVLYILCNYDGKEALYMAEGAYGASFALIIVLFILLVIDGATRC